MRINSVNSMYVQKNNTAKMQVKQQSGIVEKNQVKNNVSFNGFLGKAVGGVFGMGIAGLCTVAALVNPAGLAAAAAVLIADIGGAAVGGTIGDALTGEDENKY